MEPNFPDALLEGAVKAEDGSHDLWKNTSYPDVIGRLRYFTFESVPYILKKEKTDKKISDAGKEARLSKDMNAIVSNMDLRPLFAPVQYASLEILGERWLVCPYLGSNCEKTFEKNKVPLTRNYVECLFKKLIENRIEWPGFAPRNLILSKDANTLHAIDFEDVVLHDSNDFKINDMTLINFGLNWGFLFEGDCQNAYIYAASLFPEERITRPPLGGIEIAFQDLLTESSEIRRVRDYVMGIFYKAGRPIRHSNRPLRILDIMYDLHEEDFYFFFIKAVCFFRDVYGDTVYSHFLDELERVFSQSLNRPFSSYSGRKKWLAYNTALVLLTLFDEADLVMGVQKVLSAPFPDAQNNNLELSFTATPSGRSRREKVVLSVLRTLRLSTKDYPT